MKDKDNNTEERELWVRFRKTMHSSMSNCLDDNNLAAYLDGRHWGERRRGRASFRLSCLFG